MPEKKKSEDEKMDDKKKTKQRGNALRNFILRRTGAQDVIDGAEGRKTSREKKKDSEKEQKK